MNARLGFWLAFIFGSVAGNAAELTEQTFKLTGIVFEPEAKYALLEPQGNRGYSEMPILREGESWKGQEVISIDEKAGAVRLRESKTGHPWELRLPVLPGEEMAQRTLHFQGADLRHVLAIYQMWCGRTVIASVAVPATRLDLKSGPSLDAEAASQTLEQALAEKGLFAKPRGDKFVLVLRTNEVQIESSLAELPVAGAVQEELFPPGLVKFVEADLLQVLDVYQELTGRTILRPNWLPHPKISVLSQTSLRRSEAVWLLDALLLLADIAMVPEAEKFVFAVPPTKARRLPKFDLEAAKAKTTKPSKPGLIKLQDADQQQLLEMYAALLSREPLPLDRTLPTGKFTVRTQTELSQAEAIFVLEAIAALNHLAFELVGQDKVRMIPAGNAAK